jgi:hypothetical protein
VSVEALAAAHRACLPFADQLRRRAINERAGTVDALHAGEAVEALQQAHDALFRALVVLGTLADVPEAARAVEAHVGEAA